MTIQDLKKYIFKNNKIEFVFEALGCHNIKHHDKHDYFSASFPDGDNPQGINIRNNEYLNFRSFSRGIDYEDGKDIIDLIIYITNKNFVDSVKYLHSLFGLEYKWSKNEDKPTENGRDLSELRELVMDREAWRAAIHGVAKSRTRLSD